MSYIGVEPANGYSSTSKQTITGTGVATYNLDYDVANESDIRVYVNNVHQEAGTGKAYTVSGNQITFSENISSDDDCYVIFAAKAIQTTSHPEGQDLKARDGTFSGDVSVTGDVTVDGDATVDGDLTVDKTTYGDIISIQKGGSEVGKISTASAGATFDTGDFTYGPDKIGGFGNLKRDSFASGGRDYHQLGRFIFFPHANGTSTQDFDVNKDFGMTDTGGFVMLMGHGWQNDYVYGMVEWRNAGGGDGITNVNWREILRDGLTVTVGVTPNTNGQSIRITLGNIHNNSHGWQMFVMCPR